MRITIYTDASNDIETGITAWAAYLKMNGEELLIGGILDKQMRSHEGEAAAIEETLKYLDENIPVFPDDEIFIWSDSEYALGLYYKSKARLKLGKVKAHSKVFGNTRADLHAKSLMRNARDKYKLEVTNEPTRTIPNDPL